MSDHKELVGANPDQDVNANNLPGQCGDAGEVIGTRRGMFGASNSGDTTGYGGLVRTVRLPGASNRRPYGGPDGAAAYGVFDEIADELEGALDEQGLLPENASRRPSWTGGNSPSTSPASTCRASPAPCATTRRSASSCVRA